MKQGRTFIVAEIGINHKGNSELALDLIDEAALAGADAVKFQCFSGRFPEHEQYELPKISWPAIFHFADSRNIQMFATPFGLEEVRFLASLQTIWKIPSGMATCNEFLDMIRETREPEGKVFLSTGMCNHREVMAAVERLVIPRQFLWVLQCTTQYPCPPEDLNLSVINSWRDDLWQTGLSDHSVGIYASAAAVVMGATVIEKHITLDPNQDGPDHAASLGPDEFKAMVDQIRMVELSIGNIFKAPTQAEMLVRDNIREENARCMEI